MQIQVLGEGGPTQRVRRFSQAHPADLHVEGGGIHVGNAPFGRRIHRFGNCRPSADDPEIQRVHAALLPEVQLPARSPPEPALSHPGGDADGARARLGAAAEVVYHCWGRKCGQWDQTFIQRPVGVCLSSLVNSLESPFIDASVFKRLALCVAVPHHV